MNFFRHLSLILAASVTLAACSPEPDSANPAFWEITQNGKVKGWLLGTIHSLEKPAQWKSSTIDSALQNADIVVVEAIGTEDPRNMARIYKELGTTPNLPPLSERISPQLKAKLLETYQTTHLSDDDFLDKETWYAALILAQQSQSASKSKTAYGIDRAIKQATSAHALRELEGVRGQLMIFDHLPQSEQQDLLDIVVTELSGPKTDASTQLSQAWREGRMDLIEKETTRSLLADPELRQALYSQRNIAWADQIITFLKSDERPFIAVGAAHMAGPESLPILLEQKGYGIQRIQ